MVAFIIMVANRILADFSNQIERIDAGYALLHARNGRQFPTKCRYAGRFQQTYSYLILQVGQYSRGTQPLSLLFVPGRLEIVQEELLGYGFLFDVDSAAKIQIFLFSLCTFHYFLYLCNRI